MNNKKNDPDIFGNAIRAFYHDGDEEEIVVHSPDFDDDSIPVPYLFREFGQMPLIEQRALELSRGRVLDAGCGAGSHSLYLQETRKLEVTAIDTSEGAIEVCRERGVRDARRISFEEMPPEKFDTVLLLMNGTGIIGKMRGLDGFFLKTRDLLAPGGQVLIDSSDLSYLFDPDEEGGIWIDPSEGYYGELTYRLSYKGQTSGAFDWLYLDYASLELAAAKNGFTCELVQKGEHYDFLARLSLKTT